MTIKALLSSPALLGGAICGVVGLFTPTAHASDDAKSTERNAASVTETLAEPDSDEDFDVPEPPLGDDASADAEEETDDTDETDQESVPAAAEETSTKGYRGAPRAPDTSYDDAVREAQAVEGVKFIKMVGVHRLPPSAYPAAKVRGLYGGSMWLEMHGQQWPYMPDTGIGISGYGWVSTGYQKLDKGNPTEEDLTQYLQEGRFVFRLTPTFVHKNWFIQTQAEFVAFNNQARTYPAVVFVDDLHVRFGQWGKTRHNWDIQVGRFLAWELFHLGLGLDLNTLERDGAPDAGVPSIYGVTRLFYRPSGPGNLALHYYPTQFLRFEGLVQYGAASQNAIGFRGAAIFDWGWIKIKGGGEYEHTEPQSTSSQQTSTVYGGGGNLLFVIDPYVEFGVNAAWAKEQYTDIVGVPSPAGSNTHWTAGGFATARLYKGLLVGGGLQYSRQTDEAREVVGDIIEFGQFAHLQGYGALQYFLFDRLMIKAVIAYARSDVNATFTELEPYSNKQVSGRVQLTRYF